jgi:hypothetical protein
MRIECQEGGEEWVQVAGQWFYQHYEREGRRENDAPELMSLPNAYTPYNPYISGLYQIHCA